MLNEKAENIMVRLDAIPDTTLDYVTFMHYLDECGVHINKLIDEIDVTYQCFMLMKDYNIFVDESEKEDYMGTHLR